MDYSYEIFDSLQVIKEVYTGAIDIAFFEATVAALSADPQFSRGLNALTDFRGCQFLFSPDDLYEFRHFYLRICGQASSRSALVVDTPRETALCIVFKQQAAGCRDIEVFSTREAAELWLGLDCHVLPSSPVLALGNS